jgi:Xaa-Pro aminopeptidase
LTLAPIDRRLVKPEMLTAEESRWLACVAGSLAPLLDPPTLAWLQAATAPIAER